MKSGRVKWQEAEATIKHFNTVLTRQDKKFFTSELFKVIQDANPIDPSLQDNVLIPNNFFEYIYHIGCAINLHSIMNSGLIPGGHNLSKRQTDIFLPVNLVNKEHKDPETVDLKAPRLAWYMLKLWKKHLNTVHWVHIKLAQQKGFMFYQSRSNAIILYDTLQANCIPQAIMMETGESYTREYMRHLDLLRRFPLQTIE